jgi:hypothetical protein
MAVSKFLTSRLLSKIWYSSLLAGNQQFLGNRGAYDSIATATVGTSGVVEFTSIPSTYTHLQIRAITRNSSGSTDVSDVLMQVGSANSPDTGTNYSRHEMAGTGSAASAGGAANSSFIFVSPSPRNGNASGIFGSFVVDILDYTNTNKNKTIRTLSGTDMNGSGYVYIASGNWRNTAAINYIRLYISSVNFVTGTQFALYGIKGA